MSVLQLSVNGSVLILAVLLLRILLKSCLPRAVFSALWGMSAIRLLLPVRLESPVSIWRIASPSIPSMVAVVGQNTVQHTADLPVQSQPETVPLLVREPSWITVIWLVGTVLMMVYFAIGYFRSLRRFQKAVPIDCSSIPTVFSIAWEKRIQVRMIQDGTPLTYGILRPVILLPAHIVEKRESVSYVLLHEFTHIRRLDCLSKLLLTAALCLYWWNPLVWIMVHLANTDMEVACDEAVLQKLGEDLRKHYAAMLVELESQRVSSSPLYSCFGKNATKERIHAMMKSKRMTRFSLILSAILAVATITVFATQAPLQNVTAENAEVHADALQEEQTEQVETSEGNETIVYEEPEETLEQAETVEGHGTVVYEEKEIGELIPLEQEQPIDASWSSPLATGLSPAAAFGARIHPVFGTEAFHDGVDLATEAGSPIYAIKGGVVIRAGFDEVMGYYLEIDHGAGYLSRYQHCKELLIQEGDTVEQGNVVAYVGDSGWATGPHLHLSVSFEGSFIDPMELFG